MAFSDEFPGSALDGAWSIFDDISGAASFDVADGLLRVNVPSSGTHAAVLQRACGATPWIHTAKLCAHPGGDYGGAGIGVRDSVSGRLTAFWLHSNGGSKLKVNRMNSPTSFSSESAILAVQPVYFRIADDGTDLTYSWSIDGITWTGGTLGGLLHTEARTSWLTNGADNVCVIGIGDGAAVDMAVEWIRAGSDISDPAPGGGTTIIEREDMIVREFLSGGDMVFVLPPFLDVDGNELLAGDADTVTVQFVLPDGSLVAGSAVTPDAVTTGAGSVVRNAGDQWIVTVTEADYIFGKWELIATSSGGARPQRQIGLWGSGPTSEAIGQIHNIEENLSESEFGARLTQAARLTLGRELFNPATSKKEYYAKEAPTVLLGTRECRKIGGNAGTTGDPFDAPAIGTLDSTDMWEIGEFVPE